MRFENRKVLGFLVLVSCLLAGGSTAVAGFDEKATISADALVLRNLIGEIEIVGHGGSSFEVEVRVQGSDADRDLVRIETAEGRKAEFNVLFPLDESKRYVYPRMKGGSTSFGTENGSWLSNLLGALSGGNVKVTGSGSGLEIWADVTVRVPQGKKLEVEHGVGRIDASDVEADLSLDSRSGPITIVGAAGSISADTGSGQVSVEDVRGDLHVDTGSGTVELEGVMGSALYVDTGSGGVQAKAIGADDVTIDTGSGSVSLQLDRMGTGRFEIDTGSGSITLNLPSDASADVRAETGSGGIKLDLAGNYDVRHKDDDSVRVVIGSGEASLILDTGSGSIRITQ